MIGLSFLVIAGFLLSVPALAHEALVHDQQMIEQHLFDLQKQNDSLDTESNQLRQELQGLARQSVRLHQQTRELRQDLSAQQETIYRLREKQIQQKQRLHQVQDKLRHNLMPSKLTTQNPLWLAWLSGLDPDQARRQHSLLRHTNTALQRLWALHRSELAVYRQFTADLVIQQESLQQDQQNLRDQMQRNKAIQEEKTALLQRIQDYRTTLSTDYQEYKAALDQLILQQEEAAALAVRLLREAAQSKSDEEKVIIVEPETPEQRLIEEKAEPKNLQIAILTTPQQSDDFPKQGDLLSPLSRSVLSNHPMGEGFDLAEGVLIAGDANEVVLAPYDGRVVYAGDYGGIGKMVIIKHRNEYYSVLWHLASMEVIENQWLIRGEPLGRALPDPEEQRQSLVFYEFRQGSAPLKTAAWLADGQNG